MANNRTNIPIIRGNGAMGGKEMGSNGVSRTDRFASSLAESVTRRPWMIIGITLLIVIVAASGMRHLQFSNNYRVFFSKENPELLAFEDFQDTYTKNDNIMFVIQPVGGDVFSPDIASAVEQLTKAAWKIPYAIRVDSITNFQHSWADGDDLTVEDLIRDGHTLDTSTLDAKRKIALAEPLLRDNLLSSDAGTTGVNVTLQYPEESLEEVPMAMAAARNMAARIEADNPGTIVVVSGVSAMNNAFAEAGQKDAGTLLPLMAGVLVLFMALVLRNTASTVSTLLVIGLSAAGALGLAGYLGILLTPISVTAPVVILTLAIADSIHILVSMQAQMARGLDKVSALRESVRINLLPVAITSVTTIVGFLSMNFSDAPPFRDLGNITSMGIGFALILSLTLLPALIRVLPARAPARASRPRFLDASLERLSDFVTLRYKPILAVAGTVVVVLTALVPMIDLNDEFVKYFDYRVPFRHDAEFAIDNLNGIYLIEFSVPSDGPGGISEPEYLANLESLTGWLREQPEVMHVYSYVDIVKRLNRNMHGDDPAWHRIPEDRNLAAQYLLLYELSLPYGLDLNDRISIDKSATRLTASVGNLTTVEIRSLLDRADAWISGNTPEYMWSQPTGASVMFAFISKRNIESMLKGNMVAVVLISGIMVLALRSFAMGAISLIPNLVPILMTFGIWALLVRQVGMAAATVTATSLGIVVDDTVHFLAKFVRARREGGLEPADAIRHAFMTVGPAIVSTTAILAAGFAVLAGSTFLINSQMGLLTAMTIVVALFVDLLLLPAILMLAARWQEQEGTIMRKPLVKGLEAAAGLVLVVALAVPSAVFALTPEEKGYEVAARSDRSDRGFADSTVDLEMVLRNRAGKETTRSLSLKTLEIPDEQTGDKSMVIFDSPADIDGTALLSHARILDPDDQWLYLPALKRVKRISSVNKSGPFVGSEFAFEDFTSLELNKYDYRYLRTEPCGDLMCDVVERYPRYEHSGYTKQISWVDQDAYQVRKVDFYDRRGDLLKTLTLEDYRKYDGKYWRPHRLAMVNHQTGKSTDLLYADYSFGAGLDDKDFVKTVLRRAR
jgi:predicted RND superfamily exporter protein/outer membrane lipoprotein-sorting protein